MIDDQGQFVYGPSVVYVAPTPDDPAKGPVRGARRRARHRGPLPVAPGGRGERPVRGRLPVAGAVRPARRRGRCWPSRRPATPTWPRPAQVQVTTKKQDQIPDVGEAAPKVATDTLGVGQGRRGAARHARAAERHARAELRPGGREEAGRAAVRDAAAVPVARVRAGDRHRAPDEGQVRRQGRVHPPGGLRGQRPAAGPAQAAAGVPAAHRAVAVRGGRRRARSPPGSRARSASGRSTMRCRPLCRTVRRSRRWRRSPRRRPPPPTAGRSSATRCRSRPWLFGWAAAAVLVVSFAALALLWPKPRLEQPRGGRCRSGSGGCSGAACVEVLCGAIGVALLAIVIVGRLRRAGLGGRQPRADVRHDHLLGRARGRCRSCSATSSARSTRGARSAARSAPWSAAAAPARRPYPERLGRWPAAAGLLVFTWIELVGGWADTPTHARDRRVVGYTVVTLAAQAVWGVETWTRRGEAFSVYFNLLLADQRVRDAQPRGRRAAAAGRAAAARPGRPARSRS